MTGPRTSSGILTEHPRYVYHWSFDSLINVDRCQADISQTNISDMALTTSCSVLTECSEHGDPMHGSGSGG